MTHDVEYRKERYILEGKRLMLRLRVSYKQTSK